jgi:hypothetical protein
MRERKYDKMRSYGYSDPRITSMPWRNPIIARESMLHDETGVQESASRAEILTRRCAPCRPQTITRCLVLTHVDVRVDRVPDLWRRIE